TGDFVGTRRAFKVSKHSLYFPTTNKARPSTVKVYYFSQIKLVSSSTNLPSGCSLSLKSKYYIFVSIVNSSFGIFESAKYTISNLALVNNRRQRYIVWAIAVVGRKREFCLFFLFLNYLN